MYIQHGWALNRIICEKQKREEYPQHNNNVIKHTQNNIFCKDTKYQRTHQTH